MTGGGWIKLHRKIQNSDLWNDGREFSRLEAWIDILLCAQWQDEPRKVTLGTRTLVQNHGECLRSLDTWADRWGWNKCRVRRFLSTLVIQERICIKNENVTTRITVCNYETYQEARYDSERLPIRKPNANRTDNSLSSQDLPAEAIRKPNAKRTLTDTKRRREEVKEEIYCTGDLSPMRNGSLKDKPNGALNEKKKPRVRERMDEISDALIDLFGLVIATNADEKNIGRWRRDIYDKIAADNPPLDDWGQIVRNRHSRWPGLYPNATLTVDALVKHWDALKYRRKQPA